VVEAVGTCPGFDATLKATARRRIHGAQQITAPVTVAFGSRDLVLLRHQSRHLGELPPDTRSSTLPGCGHVPMTDDPARVADLIIRSASRVSAEPVPFVPDCTSGPGGFQVCVHPAFSAYLDSVAAALRPVAGQLAGLPGTPVRAAQMASPLAAPFIYSGVTGTPPVYPYTAGPDWTSPARTNSADWRAGVQEDFLDTVIGGPAWQAGYLGPAQQAVVNALIAAVGSFDGSSVTPQVAAAARRFAELSPGARHAWLAAYLPALRVGQITLAQLP
jgi:hypothetical protein